MEGLAALAAAGAEPERASCLWGAAAAQREALRVGQATAEWVSPVDERRLAAARTALGEAGESRLGASRVPADAAEGQGG
jgi:hypothetical protein